MDDSFEINIKITKSEYPILFQLKKKDLDNTITNIFKLGYDSLFPKINNADIQDIIQKQELNNKIGNLESTLEKLIGLSTSSSKKGLLAENILENIINERYGDIIYKKTNHIPHSGDAWLYLPDDKIIMLESKNYTSTVPKDEIIKMEFDMITHHIKWGLFVSLNSNVQGMKELDFYTFTHNNENYNIFMVSCLSNEVNKLDIGLQIIRKLMNLYGNLNKFPWIVNNIKLELTNLTSILEKNYLLRDHFYTMEKEIQKSLYNHHVKLRDYQYDMENKINDIIKKINSTMDDSIEEIKFDITKLCTNNKLLPILQRIMDVFKKKDMVINEELDMLFQKVQIGSIKFNQKKIIVNINDITLNFNIGKEKEIVNNILLITNLDL
jgi:hypothetical protein